MLHLCQSHLTHHIQQLAIHKPYAGLPCQQAVKD